MQHDLSPPLTNLFNLLNIRVSCGTYHCELDPHHIRRQEDDYADTCGQVGTLDAAAAVPATTVGVGGIRSGSGTLVLADPEDADESRNEPQKGRQEGEGNISLELAANISTGRHVAPVEDVAAVVANQLYREKR
jgi:hypothetical protein